MLEPLTVAARAQDLAQLVDYVTWAAAAAGLDEKSTYRLALAVDEIATNIVNYGDPGASGELTVRAETSGAELRVVLEDDGEPFDPRLAPEPPDLSQPIAEREDGGLGIFLALWGVDDFNYETKGGRNYATFIMLLNQGEPGPTAGEDS